MRGMQPQLQDYDTIKAERDIVVNKQQKEIEILKEKLDLIIEAIGETPGFTIRGLEEFAKKIAEL
jgi:hypothetical protein